MVVVLVSALLSIVGDDVSDDCVDDITMLPTTQIRLEMNNRNATTTTTTITTDTTIQLYSLRIRLTTFIIGYVVGMLFLANIAQVAFGVYVPIHCSYQMNEYMCVFNGQNLCTRMAMSAVFGVLTLAGLIILICTGAKGLSILLVVLVMGQLGMGLFVFLQNDIHGFTSEVSGTILSGMDNCELLKLDERTCWKKVLKDFPDCQQYHYQNCAESYVSTTTKRPLTREHNHGVNEAMNRQFKNASIRIINSTITDIVHSSNKFNDMEVSIERVSESRGECPTAFKRFVRGVYNDFRDISGPVMLSMACFHLICAIVLATASHTQEKERKRLRVLEIQYEHMSLGFD